jgi:hypothetical protein
MRLRLQQLPSIGIPRTSAKAWKIMEGIYRDTNCLAKEKNGIKLIDDYAPPANAAASINTYKPLQKKVLHGFNPWIIDLQDF